MSGWSRCVSPEIARSACSCMMQALPARPAGRLSRHLKWTFEGRGSLSVITLNSALPFVVIQVLRRQVCGKRQWIVMKDEDALAQRRGEKPSAKPLEKGLGLNWLHLKNLRERSVRLGKEHLYKTVLHVMTYVLDLHVKPRMFKIVRTQLSLSGISTV